MQYIVFSYMSIRISAALNFLGVLLPVTPYSGFLSCIVHFAVGIVLCVTNKIDSLKWFCCNKLLIGELFRPVTGSK